MILDVDMCMRREKTPRGHREKGVPTRPQKKTHLDLGFLSPQLLDSKLRKEILAVLTLTICYSCPGKLLQLLMELVMGWTTSSRTIGEVEFVFFFLKGGV